MQVHVVTDYPLSPGQGLVQFCVENPVAESDPSIFSGKKGRVRMGMSTAGALLEVGMGPRSDLDMDGFREAVSVAVRTAARQEIHTLVVDTAHLNTLELGHRVLQELVITAYLSTYGFTMLKTKQEQDFPQELLLISQDKGLHDQVAHFIAVGQGVALARDLVNMPSNMATPQYLADLALDFGQKYGFGVRVLEAPEIIQEGMGCFAAVFQGSATPAKFIVLDSDPQSSESPLVFIGKGITFDTGGISLKPAANMHEMKGDMAGAAAILGLFQALGLTQNKKQRIVGLLPCTDNMPGRQAIKPGDVVTAMNKTTVEILNTDAEGRLILADALCYSARFKPKAIIDLATLTGACVVALGPKVAAIFSTTATLDQHLRASGSLVGERFWPMPLWKEYAAPLQSEIADLKNIATREGGAIYAALFLKHFVPQGVDWAHLDIAGPAWSNEKVSISHKGATGFGVRTLWEFSMVQDQDETDNLVQQISTL